MKRGRFRLLDMTSRNVCDKDRDNSATNPSVSL